MNSITRSGMTLLIAIAVLLAIPASAETLRITASDWAPYVDRDTRNNGFALALVSTALERAGYETEVTVEPWPESLDKLTEGRYDVFATLWFRDERDEELAFSKPYIDCEIGLVRRADSRFRFAGLDSLRGLTVGVVDDYAYSKQAVDRTGIDVRLTGSVRESVAALGSGDVDLVVADRRVALFHINEASLAKRFDVLPDALLTRGLRIAVPKSRPDHDTIIAAFDAAIEAMQKDGSYDALLASYRISTW